MTPREIMQELDRYIVGQRDAKRAVAIALRNRWRRQQVDEDLRNEITPKNILMIGPTGVGKTEISRRLAKLANAPFIKYVGRDVESIVRDLVDAAIKQTREQEKEKVRHRAEDAVEEKILDILLPPAQGASDKESDTRQKFRKKLREKQLDDTEIEVDLRVPSNMGGEIMSPPGMEDMTQQLQGMFENIGNDKKKTRKLKIKDAMKQLLDEEAANLVNEDELKQKAVENVEQNGIVFLDEIDKVTRRADAGGGGGADVSREGVQRDLLPLIEGCTVSTKYGMVKTDHILFIASGAVELSALTVEDFERILTEPSASLTQQYVALLKTEDVDLEFSKDGIKRIAEVAWRVNESTENIGARRLHTVMERLLDEASYEAADNGGAKIVVDTAYVDKYLGELSQDEDLSRYIL